MNNVRPVYCKTFTPLGLQLKGHNEWYSQLLCYEQLSYSACALSLGESNVSKLGLNYPLRTGINQKGSKGTNDIGFGETIYYEKRLEGLAVPGFFEEWCVCNGVCIVSSGPLGGPSKLHGLYRPMLSYGTGVNIKSIAKTSFGCSDNDSDENENGCYICLAEEGGISMYSEQTSETHVSHVAEFRIDQILACSFGLIVVPVIDDKSSGNETALYVLTHPIKHVSKIWLKNSPQDYLEYESKDEILAAVEGDIIVFWNLITNKIVIRRLTKLLSSDMHKTKTVLNVTSQRGDISSRFMHPITPNSSVFSPHTRYQKKQQSLKVNRDGGGSLTYWPSFDFSEATSRILGLGFYPPHVCIFDDPELIMTTLFQIDAGKSQWRKPRKVMLIYYDKTSCSQRSRLALWYLINSNLFLQSVDLDSGSKLSNGITRNICDFTCTKDSGELGILVTLGTNGKIQVAWLDQQFRVIGAVFVNLEETIEGSILHVDKILHGTTIICSVKTEGTTKQVCDKEFPSFQKLEIQIMDWKKNVLIEECVTNIFEKTQNTNLIGTLISKLVGFGGIQPFDKQWTGFLRILIESIHNEQTEVVLLESKVLKALYFIKEKFQLSKTDQCHVGLLEMACYSIQEDITKNLSEEFHSPVQTGFLHVLLNLLREQLRGTKSRSTTSFLTSVPEMVQILVDNPDKDNNLNRLAQIYAKEEDLAPIVDLLVTDVFYRNRERACFDWPENLLRSCGRIDYLSGNELACNTDASSDVPLPTYMPDDFSDEESWTSHVLSMRVFESDRRLEEVCRLLDSSNVIIVDVEQKSEKSDQDFVEEQEKYLLQRVQIAFSAPVGRGAFTLRTEEKWYSDLTSSIFCPRLCATGKCSIKGTAIELPETELPETYKSWPLFHNSVASAVSVKFNGPPADAWFAYNKSKNSDGSEQAGLIFGFGLNGILKHMPPTLRHDHLAKENPFSTMAMLIGLAANLMGTGDMSTWKLISLHIGAMLPACTTELEIPKLATLIAPCALGLLFLGTHNSHISKVLLGEISKKFSPLSVFAGGNYNNSTSNANISEVVGGAGDREAHSLCAGFGLGFVSLGKARINAGSLSEDSFDGVLRRFVVGGPKPAAVIPGEEDMYNQCGQSLPSLWEEYRCCHIEEGENVNVDVTSPSAIIAVSLIYLRSGNEAVLTWLAPPSTLRLLDGVRPDLLTLRSLASVLVFEHITDISVTWLEEQLMPKTLQTYSQVQPERNTGLDHESINQAWASIICGYCLGLGIRFAGTSEERVKVVLWHYTRLLLKITSPDAKSKLAEYFPKNFLDSCICTLLISLALVQAGTGDIPVLRLARWSQKKIACINQTASSNFYGLEMCISMAIGILFLGGGRYSLSNDDKSIAVILASVFPKWPTNSNDNRYHLQALRHLYVLAAQPRLILPKPIPHGSNVIFHLEFLDGQRADAIAPVLLPPFHMLKKIWCVDGELYKIEFNLPEDLKYLQKVVGNGGILRIIRKPISAFSNYLIRQMSWENDFIYHWSFIRKHHDPFRESSESRCIRNIGIWSDWNNMQLSSLLVLRNEYSEEKLKEWILKIQILDTWVQLSRLKGYQSCLPKNTLKLLARKHGNAKNEGLVQETLRLLRGAPFKPIMDSGKYRQLEAQRKKKLVWTRDPDPENRTPQASLLE